jgi:hypothetical protein
MAAWEGGWGSLEGACIRFSSVIPKMAVTLHTVLVRTSISAVIDVGGGGARR